MDFTEPSPEPRRVPGPLRGLEPGPGWPTRGAVVRDLLLWLGASLVLLAEAHAFAVAGYEPTLTALHLVALAGVVLVLSRTHPLLAPCAAVFVCLWSQAFVVVLVCVAYLAGRRSRRTWVAVALFAVLSLAVALVVLRLVGETPGLWLSSGITLVFFTALPWLAGVHRRQHRELGQAGWEHARQLELGQRLTADRARLRERARIAQDMHDSLGHDLSLLALRAGALEVAPDLAEHHREEIARLRAGAVEATANLREIIGVLRPDTGTEPAPTAPADEGVPALVERARDSGVEVTLISEGRLDALPPMVDRAVHRVVQESLTNATKYAPGAPVEVRTTADDTRLEVRVTNRESSERGQVPGAGGGHGLTGMAERVRLTRGALTAGPHEGGWRVRATMPLDGAEVTDTAEHADEAIDRLHRAARRRVQPWTLALVAAPVVVVLLVVATVYYVLAEILAASTLPPEDFAAIAVGDHRDELDVLPERPLRVSESQLAEFDSADPGCDQYRGTAGMFDEDVDFYQLCFEDGVLTAKERLAKR
ncbi:sensor histidine kinase [Nocardiopsis sp. SBT366]|uniref:sensor histidine kinase n=1 Tax=Nocardiopsis sp. SBT366 TaxID=1580529 RepID=UPI00066BD0D4|nr:histidine kinase [Nocardiopsis sp. SBT366]